MPVTRFLHRGCKTFIHRPLPDGACRATGRPLPDTQFPSIVSEIAASSGSDGHPAKWSGQPEGSFTIRRPALWARRGRNTSSPHSGAIGPFEGHYVPRHHAGQGWHSRRLSPFLPVPAEPAAPTGPGSARPARRCKASSATVARRGSRVPRRCSAPAEPAAAAVASLGGATFAARRG